MIFPGPLVSFAQIITVCTVQAEAQVLGTYIAQQLVNCLKIERALDSWSDPNLSIHMHVLCIFVPGLLSHIVYTPTASLNTPEIHMHLELLLAYWWKN